MENNDISRMLGSISNILDDDELVFLEIKIEWEAIAKIFDIYDEVGNYENEVFYKHPTDLIIVNVFRKDKFLFKNVITYIANRYELITLEECLRNYDYIFNNDLLDFTLDNEYDSNNLKMFISFNSNDLNEANKIKNFFDDCGINCFLSAKDIEISEEYKTRTFHEICNSNLFIYLLSKNSKASDWCDQEMGMAYMKYKMGNSEIFVVSNDGTMPYGFLSSFNAGNTFDPNYLFDIAKNVDEKFGSSLVDNINEVYENSLDSKIKELYTVGSYTGAKELLYFINKHSNLLDKNQLERICDATLRNNQIYSCDVCRNPLIKILSSCKDFIDDDLYQKVFNKINPIG